MTETEKKLLDEIVDLKIEIRKLKSTFPPKITNRDDSLLEARNRILDVIKKLSNPSTGVLFNRVRTTEINESVF